MTASDVHAAVRAVEPGGALLSCTSITTAACAGVGGGEWRGCGSARPAPRACGEGRGGGSARPAPQACRPDWMRTPQSPLPTSSSSFFSHPPPLLPASFFLSLIFSVSKAKSCLRLRRPRSVARRSLCTVGRVCAGISMRWCLVLGSVQVAHCVRTALRSRVLFNQAVAVQLTRLCMCVPHHTHARRQDRFKQPTSLQMRRSPPSTSASGVRAPSAPGWIEHVLLVLPVCARAH